MRPVHPIIKHAKSVVASLEGDLADYGLAPIQLAHWALATSYAMDRKTLAEVCDEGWIDPSSVLRLALIGYTIRDHIRAEYPGKKLSALRAIVRERREVCEAADADARLLQAAR